MPPPSYASVTGEQAVNIADDNDKHTRGNLSYMPVYTFAQPYQVGFEWFDRVKFSSRRPCMINKIKVISEMNQLDLEYPDWG